MEVKKYNRTYHWITSPGLKNDDRRITSIEPFLNIPVIVTEKLDGGNACINSGKVYARSTGLPTVCPSFEYIKAKHVWKSLNWNPNISVYGENMFAKHSIYYDKLDDFYYVFGIKENNRWYSWEEIQLFCIEYDLKSVPVIDDVMTFSTEDQITKFFEDNISKPSFFGDTREGFVLRDINGFADEDFASHICKYVRSNHVQSDIFWRKNWTPNKLND